MTTYATYAELLARLSPTYTAESEEDSLLVLGKASELIDLETLGRAQMAYDTEEAAIRAELSKAACDQVEFWLEVGEEHDVSGLRGSLVGGRVQVHPVSGTLGPRPRRTLQNAGILWRGAGVR